MKRINFFLSAARSGQRFPAGTSNFSLLQNIQIGAGTHPTSYAMGTGRYLARDKWTRSDNSLPSSVEVNNRWR